MKEKSLSPSPTTSENDKENLSIKNPIKIEETTSIKDKNSESSTGEDNSNDHKTTLKESKSSDFKVLVGVHLDFE